MPEMIDEQQQIESTTVGVYRTAATVKGGRRFSFGALVVVGDKRGRVGYGYGKSKEVPTAIEKAQKNAKRAMIKVPLSGTTLPHEVEGSFLSSSVRLIPASPGTGVIAGGTVRAVLDLAGVSDCLTKCFRSTNSKNVVKAVFDGLEQLRTREAIAELRGVELPATDIEQRIEKGKRFMPKASGEKMAGPVNTIGQRNQRGGGGGRGGRGGRGGPRGGGRYGQADGSGGGGTPAQQGGGETSAPAEGGSN